jgi:hypothetical protein
MLKFASYFSHDELQKHAGLLSFLRIGTITKFIKLLVKGIKQMMAWGMTTYAVSNLGDLYEKSKEDPTAVFDPENREMKLNPWRETEGPFENLFRIGTYAFPMTGLLGGTVMLIIDKVLSKEYGMGIEDLGKMIDQKLGLKPGMDVNVGDGQLENALNGIFKVEQEEEPKKYDNNMKELKTLLGD